MNKKSREVLSGGTYHSKSAEAAVGPRRGEAETPEPLGGDSILAWERTPVPHDLHFILGKSNLPLRLGPSFCMLPKHLNNLQRGTS